MNDEVNNEDKEFIEKNKRNMKINFHSDLTNIPNDKLLEHFTK
jgi:hypothetical protein